MVVFSACALSLILLLLGALHAYWMLGGTWGAEVVVPSKEGVPLFRPGAVSCLGVALALVAAAGMVLLRAGLFSWPSVGFLVGPGVWVLVGAFSLRAIGDFRYCGLSKRVKDTRFAFWDTRVFTPLCLINAGLGWVVANSPA